MSEAMDPNARIVEEFRANEGRVGGPFAGRPLVLLHHRGRRSGRERIAPAMYLADEHERATIYVFATKGGAPTHPEWYRNLVAAGETEVERGTERYRATVRDVTGEERDRVYAEQVRRYPFFGDYAEKTKGVRTIPVLALTRV